ncbi:MAG: hypothetical protein CM15mP23_22070 [Cryomorphaceae bacterium]|nr:MAG: hypothetical protein CM15mP23_22070 [Cryomorphaceae bacterium]
MVRGDTLWGSAIYEGVVAAIDVSDKTAPVILGSTFTPGTFTHNFGFLMMEIMCLPQTKSLLDILQQLMFLM